MDQTNRMVAPSPELLFERYRRKCAKDCDREMVEHDPALLILNGPTVGVDIGAKYDIHQILRRLAGEGIGVIVIPMIFQN
jgi:ABC-type lipopolysaccharide export system ATPase subunit